MKKAFAVIGAGFGDEGKGLMTDYLVRKFKEQNKEVIVARCNGGAQAGHTVQLEDGRRHVFGHVGSGALAGAPTYLSSNFIINPYALEKEMKELHAIASPTADLDIVTNVNCKVTTIFDMALNGLTELARGSNRHGSCGMGINETVTRHLAGHQLTFETVRRVSIFQLAQQLEKIYNSWWLPRLNQLELGDALGDGAALMMVFHAPDFKHHAKVLHDQISQFNMCGDSYPMRLAVDTVIVEGAQGLMLDEQLGTFPHVTRSITGLPSAILAAAELGCTEITPVYVTRCYKTRHGAGYLRHDGKKITDLPLDDPTNKPGQWQGTMRYAPLDIGELKMFISEDLERSKTSAVLHGITINRSQLAVTCLDQVGDNFIVRGFGVRGYNNYDNQFNDKTFLQTLSMYVDLRSDVTYASYGPTAKDVKEI